MTVQLTPLSAESMGLAVVERDAGSMTIVELAGGQGNYDFDYLVIAVRKGYEDYEVVRPSASARPAARQTLTNR